MSVNRLYGHEAKGLRIKYSLSEDELAERFGIKVSAVRSWESAQHVDEQIPYKYNYRLIILVITLGDEPKIIGELEPEYVEGLTGIDAKLIRDFTGLTQENFATQVGVSTATVRKWEAKGEAIMLKQLYRDGIKRMVERHQRDQVPPLPVGRVPQAVQDQPIEEIIFNTLAVWTANIRRIGKVRLEDLSKLQADLEYMKGFIEDGPKSS